MNHALCTLAVVGLVHAHAFAADVDPAAAGQPPQSHAQALDPEATEPNVRRTVIEDDANRVDELRVRGQLKSAVVTSKGPLGSTYEIHIGDPSRDRSETSSLGRATVGQPMWRVFGF